MILFQIVFDLLVLIALGYLLYKPKSPIQVITGKAKGHEIPHCYKCDTIQKVIRIDDKFVCQICANH